MLLMRAKSANRAFLTVTRYSMTPDTIFIPNRTLSSGGYLMTSPFDPKQLEAQARAFSDKVFSGLHDVFGQQRQTTNETTGHAQNSSIGKHLDAMRDEVKSALDSQMVSFLQKMNVVTREDYELQQAMMQQTLARVEELEQTISALQAELASINKPNH